MFRTPTRTGQADDAMAAGAVNVTGDARVPVDKADLRLKAGVAAVTTAAGAALANKKAAAVARETAGTVKAYAAGVPDAMAPRVEHLRETFVDDVQPRVASTLAAIAAGAAAAKESAVEAAERAPDAYAVLKGDAVAHKGGKGKWVLLFGALAAGAALMAWRKGSHRPQPWATVGSSTRRKAGTEDLGHAAVTPASDTIGPRKSSPASERLGVPDPVILSDTEIDDLAFDDPAAAADADADALPPSTSETSEVADLSTPHLDNGSTSTRSSPDQS